MNNFDPHGSKLVRLSVGIILGIWLVLTSLVTFKFATNIREVAFYIVCCASPLYAAACTYFAVKFLNKTNIDVTSSNKLFDALEARAVGGIVVGGVLFLMSAPYLGLLFYLSWGQHE